MTTRPRPLTIRELALVVVGVAFVAVQALLPAVIERRPDRQVGFAWELYSKGAPPQTFTIRTGERTLDVTPADVLPLYVASVDYAETLPAWLCSRYDADDIEVTVGSERSTYRCP